MRKLETRFLVELDAKNDPMSFNRNNNDGKFHTIGITTSAETRAKQSRAKKGKRVGKENNFFGKKHTLESIEKSKRVGAANGMFGKFGVEHPTYGKAKSAKARAKMSISKIGDNHPARQPHNQVPCEHCGLVTQKTNYKRWHGENCKQKDKSSESA